jgi:hypothetical protein
MFKILSLKIFGVVGDQNKHLGWHILFFLDKVKKRNHIPTKIVHSCTFKKSFKKSQKLLTLYRLAQNLKKPNLGL